MNELISIIAVMGLMLGFVGMLCFRNFKTKPKKLSTYTFDFEIAKEKFENMEEVFMNSNPDYYLKIINIELNCGWDFYYKIERK